MPQIVLMVAALGLAGAAAYLFLYRTSPQGPKLSEHEANAKKAYEHAVFYAETHPDAYRKVVEKFEKVAADGEGTVYAEKAAEALAIWQPKWDAKAEGTFVKFKAGVQKYVDSNRLQKAAEIWDKFPLDSLTDFMRNKIAEEKAELRALQASFVEVLQERAKPLLAKEVEDLTEEDREALTALRRKATRPPAGTTEEGEHALKVLVDGIGARLQEYYASLEVGKADSLNRLWDEYEALMRAKEFDKVRALLLKPPEGLSLKRLSLLNRDTNALRELFETARKNLPQLRGKNIRLGRVTMRVSHVTGDTIHLEQGGAEMTCTMDKLDDATILSLGLAGETDLVSTSRKKVLYAFYYSPVSEAKKILKQAANAGVDVAYYQARLLTVLVITSFPVEAEVRVETEVDGKWQSIFEQATTSPLKAVVEGDTVYRVTVSKVGYARGTQEIKLGERGEFRHHFSLEKL